MPQRKAKTKAQQKNKAKSGVPARARSKADSTKHRRFEPIEKAALRSRFSCPPLLRPSRRGPRRMSRTETSDVPSLSSWNSSVALSSLVSVA